MPIWQPGKVQTAIDDRPGRAEAPFLSDTAVEQGPRVAVLGHTTADDLGLGRALRSSGRTVIELDAANALI
jgi:hypothetical protein